MSYDYKSLVRHVPDFPKPGIMFADLTPVFAHAQAFQALISEFAERYRGKGITHVAGIESRGFVLGAPLAVALNAGFVLLRKPGKLPRKTFSRSYKLEYGEAALHLHDDALGPKDTVLLIDDLVATGGTLEAGAALIKDSGAKLHEMAAVVELSFLHARKKLSGPLHALIHY
ncbi:MAG: adenine phosphoribosyltransferase [Deltaproteobacteria bacterium]|nr:adenine phosphoribosyltransferase [Deltaproteobacteria bacterium]